MSLKNQFKTDTALVTEGVWFDYKNSPNKDKTVPGFRLSRMNGKRYNAVMRKHTEPYTNKATGEQDFSGLSDAEAESMTLDVFLDAVLVDWRNFQPEDDGVVLEFSKENAKLILGSEDWFDLYLDLQTKARDVANFRQRAIEADAKN